MSKLHKLVATTAIVSTVAFGLAQVADAELIQLKKVIHFGISLLTMEQLLTNLCTITT